MNHGARPKYSVPAMHRNFELIRIRGRVFGVHQSLAPKYLLDSGRLYDHPAVLEAATVAEMQQRIDAADERAIVPRLIDRCEDYDLVHLGEHLYGVPHGAGPVDLHMADERRRVGAISVSSLDELREKVRELRGAAAVEFGGWLPAYERAGNCGKHPQFAHAGEPPAGYRFTCSAPPAEPGRPASRIAAIGAKLANACRYAMATSRVFGAFLRRRNGVTLRARLRVFFAMMRLVCILLTKGCTFTAVVRFLQSRNLQSQLLLGNENRPVFLTSMPFTFGHRPWIIEIEDPTTLFYPMIQNGQTCGIDIKNASCYPIIRTLLEGENCKAILTHMRSTANLLPRLFGETIARKVVYAPLGVKLPARWQHHEPQGPDEPIHLLFINSWCQVPENFFVRGGLDLLEAFDILRFRYPQLRLTLRTHLPNLHEHFLRIIEQGWVRVIDRFMTSEEMAALHAKSHVFLLPAARVHIVSLLQAMSYGLAVVASDGWGIEEYLENDRNGLVVKGRYGKTSWADPEAGILREDYEPMYTADPENVERIVEAVSRLVEDGELRRRLGRAVRKDVETRFTMSRWNEGLKKALGRALLPGLTELVEPVGSISDRMPQLDPVANAPGSPGD
jgi:glycosyltransferase involved in cell wall biosynthesis